MSAMHKLSQWGKKKSCFFFFFIRERSLRLWNPQPYKNTNDQALIHAEGLRLIILRTVETWSLSPLITVLVSIWHRAVMILNIYFSLDLEREPTYIEVYYHALTCEHCVGGLSQIILRTQQAWNSIFMIIAFFPPILSTQSSSEF